LDLLNSALSPTDLHGLIGTGAGAGANAGRALDQSNNPVNASGSIAALTNSADLGYGPVGQFTAAFWIKPVNLGGGPRVFILGTNGTVNNSSFNSFGVLNPNAASLTAAFRGSSGAAVAPTLAVTLVANEWQFLAFTYDTNVANGTVSVYRGTTNTPPTLSSTTNVGTGTIDFGVSANLLVGNYLINAQNRPFKGYLDDVQFYTRAFSTVGVSNVWNLTAPKFVTIVPPPTLAISNSGPNQLTVTWSAGTLLQATDLTGPWTTNLSASPYIFTPTGARTFFRAQVP
jgi:hypothetical protein